MFVLLMMPHVGPMIRQYNIFYSIHTDENPGPDMGQAQKRGEVKPGNAVCQLDCFSVTVR